MTPEDFLRLRLANQQISSTKLIAPAEVVGWLGAVQAQDFPSAKWALGLRLPGSTERVIEQAFNDGTILRTHVLRPTWHFVTPVDIRWMLELTAKHVLSEIAYYSKRAGVDDEVLKRSQVLFSKTLRGGKFLSRLELMAVLHKAGIVINNTMLLHVLGHAELAGIICSGPMRGKQLTWGLLNERAAQSRVLEREEAILELTRRYFTSRGPATVRDFAWWSGLSTPEIKAGLEELRPQIASETVEGKNYWYFPPAKAPTKLRPGAFLLPPFDEYLVGYTDRRMLVDPEVSGQLEGRSLSLLIPTIAMGGKIIGTWKRPKSGKHMDIEATLLRELSPAQMNHVKIQAARFGEFMGLPVNLAFK